MVTNICVHLLTPLPTSYPHTVSLSFSHFYPPAWQSALCPPFTSIPSVCACWLRFPPPEGRRTRSSLYWPADPKSFFFSLHCSSVITLLLFLLFPFIFTCVTVHLCSSVLALSSYINISDENNTKAH